MTNIKMKSPSKFWNIWDCHACRSDFDRNYRISKKFAHNFKALIQNFDGDFILILVIDNDL